ncbi:hypothetical protein EIO_1529 [Ketogulonicigenium vulgare Y25]|nr:hypothetical protein EIO_1529 [Ketogulonicigenium vulgare Y25]AOZ54567.1 hypothetical protein KVC_1553 [Ketogulonicigenium vulgare]
MRQGPPSRRPRSALTDGYQDLRKVFCGFSHGAHWKTPQMACFLTIFTAQHNI